MLKAVIGDVTLAGITRKKNGRSTVVSDFWSFSMRAIEERATKIR